MNRITKNFDTEGIVRVIAEGTASTTGSAFFRSLLPCVARALNVRYAFIAEFNAGKTRAGNPAFWDGERIVTDMEDYALAGTPCESVLDGQIGCYLSGVQQAFPDCADLVALKVQSFLAIPLMSVDNEVMGHLAIMDEQPMTAEPADMDVFRIFAARVCAELQRQRFENALIESEERLSRILASAMDAIIAIDATRHIRLFNQAAERVFGCAAGWAIGQPFDRFLSRPFRSLLDNYISTAIGQQGQQQLWAPAGMTALRANREEFPIEVTFSELEARGEHLFTVILRDVNERMRAMAEVERLREQNTFLREEIAHEHRFEDMIGGTAAMKDLYDAAQKVAATDTTVLIEGETGTGKELVAHSIHNLSARRERMLVKMNCAALPGELIESELFGHEKGAFTGATGLRKGRFEMADGGTLFLDEVGELSLPAQAKLLRVLQEQEFERVGGSRVIKVDVRVIAATNRNLGAMVKAGSFRSDLYYRLHVFPIVVPPLRERREDVPRLVSHFLGKFARKLGRSFTGMDAESMAQLQRYDWPGNIRELQNVIERAAVLSTGPVMSVPAAPGVAAVVTGPGMDLRPLEDIEHAHIRQVLQATEWVIEGKRGAAAILGLEPSTLRYRMQKLSIKRPRPGSDAA